MTSPNSKIFVGFSTANGVVNRNTSLYDIELIKQDLYYAFYTRVGERVMRPSYGCAIHDYFFENLTDFIREQIVDETIRICNLDSRVSIQTVNVFEMDNGIRIDMLLNFIPFGVVDTFTATFQQRQTNYIDGPQRS